MPTAEIRHDGEITGKLLYTADEAARVHVRDMWVDKDSDPRTWARLLMKTRQELPADTSSIVCEVSKDNEPMQRLMLRLKAKRVGKYYSIPVDRVMASKRSEDHG